MAEALVRNGMACADGTEGVGLSVERSGGAFEQLRAVADAVLYEGYLLYPYRRSSPKNRVRWQFGVLFPQDWVERDGPVLPGISGSADSWYQQTECLLRGPLTGALVRVRVRYLQMQHKQVEEAERGRPHRPVESLLADDGTVHLTFTEAVPQEREFVVPLGDLVQRTHAFPVGAPDGEEIEPLSGCPGRVVRRRAAVQAAITVQAERVGEDVHRLRVRTENTGPAPAGRAARDEALHRALIATHTLVGGDGVEFVSLIDPPTDLEGYARECRNAFTFPVLGGEPSTAAIHIRDVECRRDGVGQVGRALLSAPIILSDHPQVAPESPGDLHDAAEIDEILTLRTLLLTDEEKREARATDSRAAQILDRVESMPSEVFARLHGAIRSLTPPPPALLGAATLPAAPTLPLKPVLPPADPASAGADPLSCPSAAPAGPTEASLLPPGRPTWWQEGGDDGLSPTTDTILVSGVSVGGGSRVRLHPRGRGADAQDMFLAGRTAQVAAVLHDVDGSVHLAVTLDDDPAAELNSWYGRFHHFRPDELEPLEPLADGPEKGRSDGRS